jgi:hypothetical protein
MSTEGAAGSTNAPGRKHARFIAEAPPEADTRREPPDGPLMGLALAVTAVFWIAVGLFLR